MTLKKISTMVGAGLAAGIFGTAAMTVSSTIEARMRGRPDSTAPGKVGGSVLHVKPIDEEGEKRLSMAMHWEYGINWGFLLPVLDRFGVRGVAVGALTQFAAVWGTSLLMLPATKTSPPITEWEPEEIAIDIIHHAIYALAASAAYAAFRGEDSGEIGEVEDETAAEMDFESEELPQMVY